MVSRPIPRAGQVETEAHARDSRFVRSTQGNTNLMLTILLIVLLVLVLTGGIGYGYRGRRL